MTTDDVQSPSDVGASADIVDTPPPLSTPPDPRVLRRMERIGWTLFVPWALGLVLWGYLDPDPYANGWQLVLELAVIGGRAVNVSHGIAYGYSPLYLVFQCGLQDIVYTLILYPWVIRAYFGLAGIGVPGRVLDALRRAAERQKGVLEPFGAIGLWLFVAFPFWSTGVVNGAALGFLLGLRLRLNLAVVFSSHLTSMFVMILFFDALRGPMENFGEGAFRHLPWMVLAFVFVTLLIQQALIRLRSHPTK